MSNVIKDLSFNSFFEAAADAMLICDSHGIILAANPEALSTLNYSHELIGLNVEVLVPLRFREHHHHYHNNYTQHPEKRPMAKEASLYALRSDGSEFPAEISLSPVKANQKMYVLISLKDISKRKLIETQLAQSQAFTSSIMDAISNPITVILSSGEIIHMNKAWIDFIKGSSCFTGIGFGIGDNYFDILKKKKFDIPINQVWEGFQTVLNGHESKFELEYSCHTDSELCWLLLNVTPFNVENGGLVIVHIDITRRKLEQLDTFIKQERLNLAQQVSGMGLFDLNINTGGLYLDKIGRELWGECSPEVSYENMITTVHRDDQKAFLAVIEAATNGPVHSYNHEFRVSNARGDLKWLSINGRILMDKEVPIRHIGIIQNITERINKLEIMTSAYYQLKTFIHQAPISIAMFDTKMNYLSYSARWLNQYGRGHADLHGKNHYDIHPDLPIEWKAIHKQVLAGATLENDADMWTQKDGSVYWIRWCALPWMNENLKIGGIIIAAEDITTQKKLENEVARTREEMESLHKLHVAYHTAAAIAHELNQPLAAISVFCEVALYELNSAQRNDDNLRKSLEGSVKQTQRAGKSLHELLRFLESKRNVSEPFDMSVAIRKVVNFWKSDSATKVKCSIKVQENLPLVIGSRIQIEKVLLNLIRNGEESILKASRQNGEVIIWARKVSEANKISVSIHDNGLGISEQHANRLFTPFFSTKKRGVGLGLAISRTIIEANGGELSFDREVKNGATFVFTLPIYSEGLKA